MKEFGPDCFISGTPDIPDPPNLNERYLRTILNPDEVRLEGLDVPEVRVGDLIYKDPENPELGFMLDK